MKKHLLALAIMATFSAPMSYAEEPQPTQTPNTVTTPVVEVVDSITGVNYDVDENGEFARLRSVGRAELTIGDPKDIRVTTQKAQLRAKANIAKFLNERVTSEEVLDNVEKTTANHQNGNTQVSREAIDNYLEKIHNSAEAILKGLITVRSDINKTEKYVEVEMGYSPKTQRIADEMNNNINSDLTNGKTSNGNNASGNGSENTNGREIKKTKNYDSF